MSINKTKREIECISRLQGLSLAIDDILGFLLSESMITKEQIKHLRSSADQAKMLHSYLLNLSKENRLQLLEYEWQVLPVERIKILLISDKNSKEFSYNF